MNDGDVYRSGSGLAEVALQVAVGLAIAIGLERIRARTGSIVHNLAAFLIAALAALGIVLGLGIAENPLLTGDDVGSLIINLILLGYGLNAVHSIFSFATVSLFGLQSPFLRSLIAATNASV
ncbi:MAG: DUF2339 domain-containing protein, partial [Rhodoplanes sp.]